MTDPPLTSILVATDLSAESTLAVRAAIRLATRPGAHLHVLHAAPPPCPPSGKGARRRARYHFGPISTVSTGS